MGFERNRVVDPVVRLQLFGPIRAWAFSGESVLPRGRKAQAILSYLALSREQAVPRRRLVGLLWSRRWDEQGRASLRQSLLEIRNGIAGCHQGLITIDRDQISFDRSLVWLDGISVRDDAASLQAEVGPPPAVDHLMEALVGLDPMFDEWIETVRREVAVSLRPGLPMSRTALPRVGLMSPPLSVEPTTLDASASSRPVSDVPIDPPVRQLTLSVAPFAATGAGALGDYLLPALTQEITTGLARFRWMQVRVGGAQPDRDAHYRLEGYVRRASEECRVVVRLIDQTDRDLIAWTSTVRTSYPPEDKMIGDIIERVVEQLDPEILAIETRKVLRRPTSTNSYECVLRAIPLLYRFDADSWRRATELLEQAMALDPDHGRAFAFSALCRVTGLAQGWSDSVERDISRIDRETAHAIDCDPHDSLALALSAHILSFLHHEFQSALELFDRAIRANPSCGFSWGYSSLTYGYLAQTDEAMRRLSRARSFMIHDPYSSFLEAFHAVIVYFACDWPSTIQICRRQLQRRPTFTNIRKHLVAALCFLGRYEEARQENRLLMQQELDFAWSEHLVKYPFGRAQDRLALEAVLRHAGLLADRPPDWESCARPATADTNLNPK